MTTRVVPVPRCEPGDTVMVDGRPHLVLFHLPRLAGRPLAARVTHDPPCRLCEAPLRWELPRRTWCCPDCHDTPTREHLQEWCREHVADGVRAGKARRDRDRRTRQVARGAPGAGAVLLRAAATGGAPSRAYLADRLAGAERRALRWALRDDGDRPLSAARCREAAAELASLTPGALSGAQTPPEAPAHPGTPPDPPGRAGRRPGRHGRGAGGTS